MRKMGIAVFRPVLLALCLAVPVSLANVEGATTTKIIKPLLTGIPHAAFFGLSFDGANGIAVGAGGAIAESSDGGKTWKSVEQKESPLALLSVAKAGPHTVAVGQSGIVLIEESPGKWIKADSGTPSRLLGVAANSSGLVVAVGQFGVVIRSTDGGKTWETAAPDWKAQEDQSAFGTAEPTIYGVDVDDAGVVTLVGEYGVIMRSSDGGQKWRILRRIDAKAATLFAVSIAHGGGKSFAVGQRGEMLTSTDGGEKWERKALPTEGNFLGVAANKDGYVVVTGMRVMIRSKNDGQDWTLIREGDATTDWYQAVRVEPGSGRILAVGYSGRIIQIGD